jgi:hypothetical protein
VVETVRLAFPVMQNLRFSTLEAKMKRKKWIAHAVGVSLVGIACGSARASLIAYDSFNYTPGTNNLDGQNGGAGWVTPTSGTATSNAEWSQADSFGANVVSGSLSYPGLQTLAGNSIAGNTFDNNNGNTTQSERTFLTAPQTAGVLYISELVNLAPVAAESGRLAYAANFIRLGTGSGQYSSNWYEDFGFNGNYNGGAAAQNLFIGSGWITSAVQANQTNTAVSTSSTQLLVAELNFSTDQISLFLDPTVGAAQPAATLTATESGLSSGVSLLDIVGNDNNAGDPAQVGNLLIGTTFASVTSAVPEPATTAILAIGVMGLLARRCHERIPNKSISSL